MTKLGPHIIGWNGDVLDFIGQTKPRIIKVVAPWGHDTMKMAEARRRSPDSLWLLRRYVDNQPLDNPVQNARQFAAKILSQPNMDELYDIYEDYNEIDPRDHSFDPPRPLKIDTIKRYNEFSTEFSHIIHSWGKKHVTGCWSNAQPPDGAWQYMTDCVLAADYVSLHGYGWPTMGGSPQFTLRYRHIYHGFLPFKRPLILSEQGMTHAVFGGPDLGWKSWEQPFSFGAKERAAAEQWAWMLDRANEDRFVFSFHPYTTGRLSGDNWGTHDFTSRLYNLVGDYIKGHPSPDGGGGGSMETDSPLATWREGVPLGNYSEGPTEKTEIVLHSTGGSFTSAVNWFLNPDSGFATQYVIGRGHAGVPKIYQLVKESDIGHHAGTWQVNTKSIGIECADDNLDYLTIQQRQRLVVLCKDIVARNPIERIRLHREIVSTRCPQAISDIERDQIVIEVFGGVDYKKKYEGLRNGVVAAINTLKGVLNDG